MILSLSIALLTFAVLIAVLTPLMREARPTRTRADFDRDVYRNQVRDIERDIDRGLVTGAEAGSMRVEVRRRLLSVMPDTRQVRTARARWVAAATGIAVGAGAVGVYLFIGTPGAPEMTARTAGTTAEVMRLATRAREKPGDVSRWLLYARALSKLEQWNDAEAAWRHVISLGDTSPVSLSELGEILVLRQNGQVGDEARSLFETALAADPANVRSRYYLALTLSQRGDAKGAIAQWRALLDDLPADAPGREEIMGRMTQTAQIAGIERPAPPNQMVAIEAMVTKLAARLNAKPDDPDGWTQLGRSYAVLGRDAEAAEAFETAAAQKPADPMPKLWAAEALLAHLKPQDALPPHAVDLLRQVETLRPREPAVLWYLGLFAARGGQLDVARVYWTRLEQDLPPDGEESKMVHASIEALSPHK